MPAPCNCGTLGSAAEQPCDATATTYSFKSVSYGNQEFLRVERYLDSLP